MVLWKKESASPDACYVDFLSETETKCFDSFYADWVECNGTNKDDDISIELRMEGNQRFKEKKWYEAMELYNRSLRYATDGSENVSMAYANRSLCFFQIQLYDKCLVDIELAKKANYPERLMPKLDDREATCLKLIGDKSWKPEEKIKPALSFDADEQFPDLANALETRHNAKYGNHFVAKRNIDVGQIVILGDMFVTSTHNQKVTYCKTCLKHMTNLVPCLGCSDVMFCDDHCMASNSIHTKSCSALRDQTFVPVRLVESILIAVTAFPNAHSLMEFVASALATSDFHTPECSAGVQTKYRSFLKLDAKNEDMNDNLKRRIFLPYHLLMKMPEIKQRFQSTQEKCFLAHLILQHEFILNKNTAVFLIANYIDQDNSTKRPDVSGVWPFLSVLKINLCVRNVAVKQVENQMFVYAVRPILAGEPLFVHDNHYQKGDDQCKCSKCASEWTQEHQHRLKSEPDYQFFAQSHMNDHNDPEKRLVLKTKMANLLQKYGRLPWSEEVEWISKCFDWAMTREFCD